MIELNQHLYEVEVLKMLDHPNLIKLHSIVSSGDKCNFVMDYVAGKDLYDYLQTRGYKLPETLMKRILLHLLNGLKHLHENGIIHRDLKLENVMMSDKTDQAIPKIVDFGLSKILGPSQTATEPYGTVGYVAPEVMSKIPYSFSADVWSLGCIAYALICGSLPYNPNHEFELQLKALREHQIFRERQWQKTSNQCIDLIQRMLFKEPS